MKYNNRTPNKNTVIEFARGCYPYENNISHRIPTTGFHRMVIEFLLDQWLARKTRYRISGLREYLSYDQHHLSEPQLKRLTKNQVRLLFCTLSNIKLRDSFRTPEGS